ncbi:MAG: NUDIX hydrolase [Desulfobulbaceae bacterium BRH_c16a]|nr:MAG: NUDIX hydrolase [Desulfobulbaceae bacterium BRH_c16a]
MKPIQPNIDVSCAIIEQDGQVLAAQRGEAMNMPLKWEFPGGKVEPHESAATCLRREIREELGVDIRIITALPPSEWSYPDFTITLYPFVCHLESGMLRLAEHRAVCWLSPEKLPTLDWAEADEPVLQDYFRYLKG